MIEMEQNKKDIEINSKNSMVKKTYNAKYLIEKRNNYAHTRLEEMRQKYKQLFFKSNKVEIELPKQLSQQEIELIENVIKIVGEKIKEIQLLPNREKVKVADDIVLELKKIEKYQLSIMQAEELYKLINSEELKRINIREITKVDSPMNRKRREIAEQLGNAIEFKQYEIEDIEELKVLERKITTEMLRENPVLMTTKNKLSNKISTIKQKKTMDRIRVDIPTNIESIITDLVNGNIDIKEANKIINEEARRRVESKPKTRFSLTEEQEKKQILIQIRTAIIEKADKYKIKNPEMVILKLEELSDGETNLALRTVIKNLIEREEFEEAKRFCDKYYKEAKEKYKENEFTKYIRGLRNEIRNAEIGNIVLTAINMKGTIEEERMYFELIDKGLKMGNVKLGAISLGKSKDGLKNITLADIWEPEKIR